MDQAINQARQGAKSISSRFINATSARENPKQAIANPVTVGPVVAHPTLSNYILIRALKKPEGVSFTDLARALLDAKDRANDKSFRSQFPALLLRLCYYEEVPSDVVNRLVPLFPAYIKDPRVTRTLFYICGSHITRGSAGTPTLLDGTTTTARPDVACLQAVFVEAQRMLLSQEAEPQIRRAAAFLMAAAARSNDTARKETLANLERAVDAADALANAAGGPLGPSKGTSRGNNTVITTSATNWELQHTLFATIRMSDAPATATELSRGCFQGLCSPDPSGARHAIAIVSELALRDPSLVMHELSSRLTVAADAYEANGPGPATKATEQGINIEDSFARLHLARTCAAVLHSDQGVSDVGRGGGPYWRMLCLLATRDTSDLVRFGALEAMTGSTVMPSSTNLTRTKLSGKTVTREATVIHQRRARAWRLLVSQSATTVTIPGLAQDVKLIEVIARFLLLALSKAEAASRFCVAASVTSSLAESCLASQSSGTSRHVTSPDMEKVIAILIKELETLIESPLRPAQRCGCIEALLYFQAAGYSTNLTPAKLASVGGRGSSGGSGDGVQDVLLTAVLKCAKAQPKDAANFLTYASGVAGIAPSGMDLNKVTELWDAAVAAGKEGKAAALIAAMETLSSPPPPSTRPRATAGHSDIVRAAKEEAGWNAFVSTAAWWLGEHANELCDEYVGEKVTPPVVKTRSIMPSDDDDDDKEDDDDAVAKEGKKEEAEELHEKKEIDVLHFMDLLATGLTDHQSIVLSRQSSRNPALSRVISALHDTALTSTWQLRASAARALGKIAIRSGEPFRLQCYGILTACCGSQVDALGLQGVVSPALKLLDKIYATQIVLASLWKEHGDDIDTWPEEAITSLSRRASFLRVLAERTVCTVPKDKYALLGPKAVLVLANAQEEGPAYASFLQSQVEKDEKKKAGKRRDEVGVNITVSKNKEIEDILSFGGSESSFKPFSVGSEEGKPLPQRQSVGDRNVEIDTLFSATGLKTSEKDMWVFSDTNAFANDATTYDVVGGVQTGTSEPQPLPSKFGSSSLSPTESPVGSPARYQQQQEMHYATHSDAAGTARVVGSGTMLHTFIADASNPEELSIFEGDYVDVLEESDGWMLVRDQSGSQGLVPTAYVRLEKVTAVDSATTIPVSPTQRATTSHARMSTNFASTSNEDFLDRFFNASGATSSAMSSLQPGMPEGQEWIEFGSSTSSLQKGSPRGANTLKSQSPASEASLSRQSTAGNREGIANVQLQAGNPFTGVPSTSAHHRRLASQTSHHRTLSGGSDPWGSLPGTPGSFDGPERPITARFDAEMEGELTVEVGDKVKVHSDVGGWARVLRISDAKSGLVPSWAVGE